MHLESLRHFLALQNFGAVNKRSPWRKESKIQLTKKVLTERERERERKNSLVKLEEVFMLLLWYNQEGERERDSRKEEMSERKIKI